MPRSRRFGFLDGLPGTNSRSTDGENSLVAGKNAGNFTDSALSCENMSLKHRLFQMFTSKFPTGTSRELIRAGNSSAFSTGAGNLARASGVSNFVEIHRCHG